MTKQRGRTSIESLMITETGLAAAISYPDAPYELTDEEADQWRDVVASMPPDHFIPANYPILVQLCRHVVEARRIANHIIGYRKRKPANFSNREYYELLKVQESQSLVIARLSRSMRLTQQATRSKNMRLPGRRAIIAKSDVSEEW